LILFITRQQSTCIFFPYTTLFRSIAELKHDYDYIIIDCPAGIEQGFQNAISGADKAIVITTPEKSSVRDADRIIGLLKNEEIDPDRKSTRLNSSHVSISYAVFCLT